MKIISDRMATFLMGFELSVSWEKIVSTKKEEAAAHMTAPSGKVFRAVPLLQNDNSQCLAD